MLQSLNTSLFGKIARGFLVLFLFGALAGLIISDVGGFFKGGGISRNDVAKVGSETISIQEFVPIVQRASEQMGLSRDQVQQLGLPYMMLQQEINHRILKQIADAKGIRISDAYIASELLSQLDKVPLPGTNKEKLSIILQQQGINEKQLVEEMRQEVAANVLNQSIATPLQTAPPYIAEQAYKFSKQKRDALVINVTEKNLKQQPKLNEKAIETFYNENKENYRTEEIRDVSFFVLEQKKLIPEVTITDAQISDYYQENIEQFIAPDRVQMSQVITQSEDEAKDIIAKQPNDLSSYQSKSAEFLTTDWYAKDGLSPILQEALFKETDTKGLVGPIKTDLGWHVMMIENHKKGEPQPLDKVSADIREELKNRAVDDLLNSTTDEIESLIASSNSLEQVAKELKTSIKSIKSITPSTMAAKIDQAVSDKAAAERLKQSLFQLEEGQISPIMDTSKGDIVLAQLTQRQASVIPELSTIHDRVKQDAMKAAIRQSIEELADQAIAAFDPSKTNEWLAKLGDMNLETVGKSQLDRAAATKQLDQEAANLLFTLTPESPVSSINSKNGMTIIYLKDIKNYTGAMDNGAIEANQRNLNATYAQEIQQQFLNAARREISIKTNDALLQQVFSSAN